MAVLGPGSSGLDRYDRPIPGTCDRWWFRRRVPLDLVNIIDLPEWRYRLKARNRDQARREAFPYLDETDETIRLAKAGNRPPINDEEIQALAIGWWSDWRERRFTELKFRLGQADAWIDNTHPVDWALANEIELIDSANHYLEGPRSLD